MDSSRRSKAPSSGRASSLVSLAFWRDVSTSGRVGYDRWRIDDLKADLDQEGIELPLEPFGQGFKDMAPAIDFFAELALTSRLRHGGHPVLTANVANAIVVADPAGNQKIDKQKSNRRASSRIDGAVSMAMALGTAKRFVEVSAGNIDDFFRSPVHS